MAQLNFGHDLLQSGRDGARTRDLYHVEVALYQLSYAPLLS